MMLPTASALARALFCPGSVFIPQADDLPSEYGEQGTAVHQCADSISVLQKPDSGAMDLSSAVAEALSYVPAEHRELCSAVSWEKIPTQLSSEIPFAYNVITGEARWLPKTGTHRDYSSVTEWEIAGTIDLVGVGAVLVYIGDIKTGYADLGPPEKAAQLLIAALAATRILSLDRAELQWVRVHDDDVYKPRAFVDIFDLDVFAEKLSQWAALLAEISLTGEPESHLRESEQHCKYCPSLPNCPLKRSLALELCDGSLRDQVEQWPLKADSPLDRYRQWKFAQQVTNYMSRRIHAEAIDSPIDLGNGKIFGQHIKPGNEKLDGPTSLGVLSQHVPLDVAMGCIEPKVTKASIKRGLKGRERGLAAKVIKEIRKAGGAKKAPKVSFGEFEPAAPGDIDPDEGIPF
jgi:hypothetical protein